jgi:exopolyphosphatase/guanosine-5'-triphosphate,3'-diphosphate pyrophosphatase
MKRRASRSRTEILGAVDLGSNSFHMVIARFSHGQLTVMDRLRESVRMAAGLDRRNRLDASSQRRALECLARFGERLRSMHADRVRVVGTNTLRKARRSERFRREARRLLGHPVEVISGIEEARLIYIGVSRSLPNVRGAQLVVDIGGGSTEVIRGHGLTPKAMESLYMGCVGLTAECFADGKLNERNFRAARQVARRELAPIRTRFAHGRIARVAGASGTIRAASDVLGALGRARKGIGIRDLEYLIEAMIACGHLGKLYLPGLSADRAEVFPGGIAILVEVLAALDVNRMIVADGALREGILYDMVGRLTREDARVRTVRAMQERFRVDTRHAKRVAETAARLWRMVADDWEIDGESERLLLSWAAGLHELGLDIAHAHHQHHGAYLLENADMPGFARDEQRVLACLVRAHRRKLGGATFAALPREWRTRALRLGVLLRLAVLFHRSRGLQALPPIGLTAAGRSLRLVLPAQWLRDNPLTRADLDQECDYLQAVGIEFAVAQRRRAPASVRRRR